MQAFRKKRFIFLSLTVLLLACVHLLLKYQSRQVFGALVREFSKGEFKLETDEVDISYVPFGVEVYGLRLTPTNDSAQIRKIECERVGLHIESLYDFLFHRSLDLKELVAIRPSVALRESRSLSNAKNISVKDLREQLFRLFDRLRAENILLNECALRIEHSALPHDYFSINRFTLALNDFHLENTSGAEADPFRGDASFSLINPDIHLADTNLSIGVHEVSLDKLSGALRIDSLLILVKDEELQFEGIRLASVSVKNLNWSKFMESGEIEIDSASILSGNASLNLSKSERTAGSKKKERRRYEGSPVTIHHVSIKDISYALLMNDYMGKRDNKVLFSIQGEHFEIGDLRLDPEMKPAISAREIDVRLKDYKENDADDSYEVSLGALKFKNGDLVLNDYLLRPKNSLAAADNNKVHVPKLHVQELSMEEMLMKRVQATRLVVVQPEVVIDLKKGRKRKSNPESADEALRRLMNGMEDRVAVGNIMVENGSLRLQSTDSTGQDVVISGIALNIAGNSAVKCKSVYEALRSIDEFRTGAFNIRGPSMNLSVNRLRWLPNKTGLRFDHVTGSLGNGSRVAFHGMEVGFRPPLVNKQGFIEASYLTVDSGDVVIKGPFKKNKQSGPPPLLRVDEVRLNDIDIAYQVDKSLMASSRISISIDNLDFGSQQKLWRRISLSGIKNLFHGGNTTLEAREISAEQPGMISFLDMKGHYEADGKDIRFTADEFVVDGDATKVGGANTELHAINLKNPKVEAVIRLNRKAESSEKKSPPAPSSIGKINLTNPEFQVHIIDEEGKTITRSRAIKGEVSIDSLRLLQLNNSAYLSADRVEYRSNELSGQIKEKYFNPTKLDVIATDIRYDMRNKTADYRIEKLRIEGFDHTIVGSKNDSTRIIGGSLEVTDHPMHKGDSLDWKSLLRNANWSMAGVDVIHTTSQSTVEIKGVFATNHTSLRFGLDELAFGHSGTRESYWQKNAFEKDFIRLRLRAIECNEADLNLAEPGPTLTAKRLNIGLLEITPERDKTRPEDTVSYRPLLAQQIASLPLRISVDTIQLLNGSLIYNEIGQKTGKEGALNLTKLNGYVAGLRNFDIGPKDSLSIRMSGMLFDQAPMRITFRQSYTDSLQGFWMRMRLGGFDMARLNGLLSPLMRIELQSGRIDTMTILVKGNDHFAFGTIDMKYKDLFVCLKSDGKKKGPLHRTADWAANLYIRNTDNGKPNMLFRKRIKKRGQFNFWGKIAVEGLLSDIGVKRDESEISAFEKAVRTYGLPSDYWNEE